MDFENRVHRGLATADAQVDARAETSAKPRARLSDRNLRELFASIPDALWGSRLEPQPLASFRESMRDAHPPRDEISPCKPPHFPI
jgi:hypothetical protein